MPNIDANQYGIIETRLTEAVDQKIKDASKKRLETFSKNNKKAILIAQTLLKKAEKQKISMEISNGKIYFRTYYHDEGNRKLIEKLKNIKTTLLDKITFNESGGNALKELNKTIEKINKL